MLFRFLARRRAVGCYERGREAIDRGDLDVAVCWFREAIRLDPRSDAGFAGRGFALLKKFCYREAIADLSEAIRLNPDNAFAYYCRGLCYHGIEDDARAAADHRTADRLDPGILSRFDFPAGRAGWMSLHPALRCGSDHSNRAGGSSWRGQWVRRSGSGPRS